jgi:hypothetical protein
MQIKPMNFWRALWPEHPGPRPKIQTIKAPIIWIFSRKRITTINICDLVQCLWYFFLYIHFHFFKSWNRTVTSSARYSLCHPEDWPNNIPAHHASLWMKRRAHECVRTFPRLGNLNSKVQGLPWILHKRTYSVVKGLHTFWNPKFHHTFREVPYSHSVESSPQSYILYPLHFGINLEFKPMQSYLSNFQTKILHAVLVLVDTIALKYWVRNNNY